MRKAVGVCVVVFGCVQLSAGPRAAGSDWLVDEVKTPVRVEATHHGRGLVMDNGLIRRVFRLRPNAATVAFDNLMTGQSMLRAVKPEATVDIEGMTFAVGGLKCQPNLAYLLDEWVDAMQADPRAFHLVDYEVGPTQPRLAWKRVRYSADLPWPPPGKRLTMRYRLLETATESIGAQRLAVQDEDRIALAADDMQRASDAWKVQAARDGASSFSNEGKFGEIHTPANTCIYAERLLPDGAQVVQCRVDPGTDASASWGPGITLVWPRRTVKFYMRPGEGRFGLFDGQGERLLGHSEPGQAWWLRIEIAGGTLFCDISPDGVKWSQLAQVDWGGMESTPERVRVGKTSRTGGCDDFGGAAGDFGRCRVSDFRVYGGLSEAARARRREALGRLGEVTVRVHYEMYEGVPVLCKWLTIHNGSQGPVRLNSFTSEMLAMVEFESHPEAHGHWNLPNIHVESDYSFAGMNAHVANQTTRWQADPEYLTQVDYLRENPCLLVSLPPVGPDVDIEPGGAFESFRTFEMPFDSTDRERKGLAVRRMYRTIAPWVTENPIMMHVRQADPAAVKLAIDQCAEVGFEMVIMTFGSGFNIENEDPAYLAQICELVEYAHGKGIELGGYSLLSSRRISDEHDVIDVKTGRPGGAVFGTAPCIGSQWGIDYFRKLYAFFEKTGFDLLEHDGSYPGDSCASANHPGHRGYADSQYAQWKVISDFYKWCRSRGVYLNVPDFYYLTGSTKCAMGYRETNWSLPRAQQIIHGRQNIYDGTWTKTPSMGWMFVPLVEYHGGGPAATLEPLAMHLDAYGAHLAQNFGCGVQACYRGPRLYDTDETKAVVKKWVDFYKRHRAVLDSDIIHVRRADGHDIDCMMHVNPRLKTRALAMVFNPLNETVERELELPLYYTGLTKTARAREQNGKLRTYTIDHQYRIRVPLRIAPASVTWLAVE